MMSRDLTDLWPLIQDTRRKLFAARMQIYGAPPIKEITDAFNLTDSVQVVGSLSYMLENYNAETLSTDHYRIRNSYDNPAVIERQFLGLHTDGLIEQSGDAYRVTYKGRQLYTRIKTLMRPRWTFPDLNFSAADFERLIGFMRRLKESTYATTEPPVHWSVTTRAGQSVKLAPDAAPLEQLDWHVFDLWAYRDDVHLATWQQYGVSPFAWEALSYLWNGQVDSAEKLVETNAYREFTVDEWTPTLDELVGKDWAEKNADDTYTLTDAGKAVRDESERLTDEYFYAPWAMLSDGEIDEFCNLFIRLRAEFERIAAG